MHLVNKNKMFDREEHVENVDVLYSKKDWMIRRGLVGSDFGWKERNVRWWRKGTEVGVDLGTNFKLRSRRSKVNFDAEIPGQEFCWISNFQDRAGVVFAVALINSEFDSVSTIVNVREHC